MGFGCLQIISFSSLLKENIELLGKLNIRHLTIRGFFIETASVSKIP